MKIYVDKIPGSCRTCRLSTSHYFTGYDMTLHRCSVDDCIRNLDKPDLIEKPCPLESLQAHDIEVTRQTCEEFIDWLNKKEKGVK